MSFRVVVSGRDEPTSVPNSPEEIDAWLDRESEHTIYDEPVASDDEFFSYWHTPAVKLGLELLSHVYEYGLDSDNTSTLRILVLELTLLEGYWTSLDLPKDRMDRLVERMGLLRKAIQIATEQNALLSIS